jgi:predicted TIM-barrel fold metal-dependent hydrolase
VLIIDCDSHFEPGPAWLTDYPDLAARLPPFDTAEVTTKIIAGDILRGVPPEQWPSAEQLVPPGMSAILGEEQREGYGYEGSSMHAQADPDARVAWLDDNSIDLESVICLEGMVYARYTDDAALSREAISLCNSWLAATVAGHRGRLMPVTCLDLSDVDWAVAELGRMRALGSRAFLIGTIPVPGIPMSHPSFDPVWSAAVELGMVALLHVGYNPASFDAAWANTGGDMMVLRQLAVSQGHQSVELMFNGMVFGGVFHRHPDLTVLVAECGIHWFTGMVEHMDARDARSVPEAEIYMGRYPYDLSPSEFIRRNVRITPLPRRHQSPARLLAEYPDCVVFSSDYAHNEGSRRPTAHYEELLADIDPAVREGFLGRTIADCYARMGDPLPVPAAAQ